VKATAVIAPTSGYHNKEWADKMRLIGLIPTDTGQEVTHLVEEGRRFDKACAAFLAEHPTILYHDRAGDGEAAKTRRKKAASKTKYTCPGCELNAWAKPDA
jgi:hypothetical protein